jgi:trans-2,3-dihydro-3-hydroxyanthranilate isomerase
MTADHSSAGLTAGLIDVFADVAFGGNPLAVVQDADRLTDADMRAIAGEFNQAETTFISASPRADRKLRSFTAAGVEVFGAGHNALGAWLWLAETGALGPLEPARTFHQEIGGAVLPVTLERVDGRIRGVTRQGPLRLGPILPELGPLAEALGLEPGDVITHPAPRTADTGAPHLLVRLTDIAAVDRAEPRHERLLPVLQSVSAEGCYIYAFAGGASAYARFFNPTVGLWEDAATGTAAGPLAAYLSHSGVLAGETLAVEQGVRIGRRSLLTLRLTPEPELSGCGVIVLRGQLRTPADVGEVAQSAPHDRQFTPPPAPPDRSRGTAP